MASAANRRKIAYIGSSYKFVHQSARDFVLCGQMEDTDLVLYDIDPVPLKIEVDVITRMIKQGHSKITVRPAKSRAEALAGADYVVTSLLIGGMDLAEKEDRICQQYGIRHTVGDTIGPMCTARCLRMVPLLIDIARDMEKLCPHAWMLNVTNPMTVVTNAVNQHTNIRCIGICHGTHFRISQIAQAYHAAMRDVRVNVVGVNHLGFIDGITVKGEAKDPFAVAQAITEHAKTGHADVAGYQDTDVWANTFARRLGIIPNNGDHHFSEFFQWFLHPAAFGPDGKNKYDLDSALHDPAARRKRQLWFKDTISDWAYKIDKIPDMDKFSSEHLHDIMFSLEGIHGDSIQRELHLNVTNGRAVPNLPPNCNVEITCTLSAAGVHPVEQPPLPLLQWGFLAPLVAINLLTEQAAVKRDKKAFLEALHLDPLVTDFKTIPQLADELWAANEPYIKPVK